MSKEQYDSIYKRIEEKYTAEEITFDEYIAYLRQLNDIYEKEKVVEPIECPYHGIHLVPGDGTHYCPHLSCNYYIHDKALHPGKQAQYKTFEKMLDEHYRAGQVPWEVYSDISILLRTKYILPEGGSQ
ncbi:hypothetical protein BC01_057 [Bacillus phage BC01]|nr:hypothetical protein PBC6_050 [Bacillus phage PBC6]AXU41154.1 hypothetical protein BC01_057 [Bacillus phage BC01]